MQSLSLITALAAIVSLVGPSLAAAADVTNKQTKVCVDVSLKDFRPTEPLSAATTPAAPTPVSAAPTPVSAAPTQEDAAPPPVSTEPPPVSAELMPAEAPAAPSLATASAVPKPAPTLPLPVMAAQLKIADDSEKARKHIVDPARYLTRFVEYQVTHEVGYEAVTTGCDQRITLELYPLEGGYTAFGRYTGTSREEKVDYVQLDEFVVLSRRMTRALLHDLPMAETIDRESVLRADSVRQLRTVEGKMLLTLALGTSPRIAKLPTATTASQAPADEFRYLAPVAIQMGSRGKYQAWGVDVFGRLTLGTGSRALLKNDLGGHADFASSYGAGIHFLRYLDATGVTSWYTGGGASFELARYTILLERGSRDTDDREGLWTGGLNVDLVLGYEFMRASALHFFIEGEVNLPTYRVDTDNQAGGISAYVPGATILVGLVF